MGTPRLDRMMREANERNAAPEERPWLLFNHARAVEEQLESLRRLVADDAWAATFQSLGQYRTALLREIDTDIGQARLRSALPGVL